MSSNSDPLLQPMDSQVAHERFQGLSRRKSTFSEQISYSDKFKAELNWMISEVPANLRSGITVALVNILQCISLAIASGASPVPGIVTGFWGGLLAAFFGGSEFNILGPSGALVSVLAMCSASFGPSILPYIALFAGICLFISRVTKLHSYLLFLPSSVVHGFTAGVAFVIAFNQIDFAFGLEFKHQEAEFIKKVFESIANIPNGRLSAIIFTVLQTYLLLYLQKHKPGKIPWAIIIACGGIFISFLCVHGILPFRFITLEDKFGKLQLSIFKLPEWNPGAFTFKVFSAAISVAFIIILETLISARMADEITKTDHDREQEVFGAGLANFFAGLFGGIPATAALARTVLNIKTGATSRVSGIIAAFTLLIIALVILPVFQYLPMPTVAALLVVVAWRMIEFDHIEHLYKYDRRMFLVLVFTTLVCIFMDTMSSLVLGGLASLLFYASDISHGYGEARLNSGRDLVAQINISKFDQYPLISTIGPKELNNTVELKDVYYKAVHYDHQKHPHSMIPVHWKGEYSMSTHEAHLTSSKADLLIYKIVGQVSYVNGRGHVMRLKKIITYPNNIKNVIMLMISVEYIDIDGIDSIKEIVRILNQKKIKVVFAGMVGVQPLQVLRQHDFFVNLDKNGQVFDTYDEALDELYPIQDEA